MPSSSLTCTKLTLWTFAAVFLQILGLSLFISGFFPIKPTLSGVSGRESFQAPNCNSIEDHEEKPTPPPDQLRSLYKEISGIPSSFDRLILMVVDGLPAEFVLGKDDRPPTKAMMEAMPYTQSLLLNGSAVGYHAKAAPPTVTMPRLKAMVSGAIGGFLDVAFNFNTQALLDDNLLGQFYAIGWKMVIHGDETWIKLFPGLFTRHDGVSSFFVKDTIEVDQNVSRHLDAELMTNDWDLLILHYLGLDHVGHIGGRNSVLMAPKLKEMDEVIKRIHISRVLNHDHHHGKTLLMVVSDHGMTDSGNHGGSSYEETDSLALFIGLGSKVQDYAAATRNVAFQVDIAPTLALLFSVPIPKNNVGVLIAESFKSLTEEQQLRALELNSWQLLRLLQAQLPGLLFGNPSCRDDNYAPKMEKSECDGSVEQIVYCLFSKAAALHSNWTLQKRQCIRATSSNDFNDTVAAYNEFLKTASAWLSRTATDKPLDLLAFGVAAMLISCVMFLGIQLWLSKALHIRHMQCLPDSGTYSYKWHLDDSFLLLVILILVFSMGSSSMVEEEQYTLHFLTSTLYLMFLRKSCQSPNLSNANKRQQYNYSRTYLVILVLILGRILRGWHQGGVNWVHLPDIAKWLEKAGPNITKSMQITSGLLMISLSLFTIYVSKLKRMFVLVVRFSLCISGLLVLLHIVRYQEHTFAESSNSSNLVVQTIYTLLMMIVMVAVLGSPWVMPISISTTQSTAEAPSVASLLYPETSYPLLGFRASVYLIGCTYIVCWSLLQLIVQKPTNAMPTVLLLVQILASMFYFSGGNLQHKQWVEVAAIYLVGLTGHFSLGNTNTLATIDVAGAFIGISSHSTLLSGVLMFIITYASPLLCLLSLPMYISMKDVNYLLVSQDTNLGQFLQIMIGIPCLVPLSLNSVVLTTFTIILLLMRNHLFVWSVFSPKYLYVCATTVCVYIGVSVVAVTVTYTCLVLLSPMVPAISTPNDVTEFVVKKGNGVKGLAEVGLKRVPDRYIQPMEDRMDMSNVVTGESIPLIDMSEYGNNPVVANLICVAAEKWGFFQIINHGVPIHVLENVKEATNQFFGLSSEEKNKYTKEKSPTTNVRYGTSFFPQAEKSLEWKDYLSMFYTSEEDAVAFWPKECKDQVLEYMNCAEPVVKKLLETLMKKLDVKEIDEAKSSLLMGSTRINLNYYPKCPNPELTVGNGRHSDVSTLTVLLQDDIGGLYVRGINGNTWVHVPPVDGSLVINIGDALQILSNGRYKSVEHQVVANGNNNRVSIPIFVNPRPNDVIGPLAEVIESGEKAVYKEVVYSDYVRHFFKKALDGKKTVDFAKI